jgi:hypothetical protein
MAVMLVRKYPDMARILAAAGCYFKPAEAAMLETVPAGSLTSS